MLAGCTVEFGFSAGERNKCLTAKLFSVWDRRQLGLLTLSDFKSINQLLFPLKSSENLWFSDDIKEKLKGCLRYKTILCHEVAFDV